ncbi:hypothetical protein DV096_15600 [Bradymonadaceae bacterium TMQ3]|uniref:Uncharacterized protein n=1 Tax=Lujinxingia sediminis TaxID=2480984 RepID=A0ABY0CR39_9DELT|nr:hypothetical protein [Lujinxingia sediminis]RDV36936.1 hypothetical protein DV096_15600 [Bradymonadaceae bacterium TMQ3]RVU42981.1 hypothetical protein EA187_14190 [Lujinxingia sediminis]TXC73059.1 hypothetical protein FRC91_16540 [Bradymonadales bacterium TMQ1]
MNAQPSRFPHYLAASFVATPLLFFASMLIIGPAVPFGVYLFIAWSTAALTSALSFAAEPESLNAFTSAERLGVLAGNAMIACLVATLGFIGMALSHGL